MEELQNSGLSYDEKKQRLKDAWENCSAAEKDKEKKIYDEEIADYNRKIEEYEKLHGKKQRRKNHSPEDSVEKPKKSKAHKSKEKSMKKNGKKDEPKKESKKEESKRDDKSKHRRDDSPKKAGKKR